jgi:alpha-galactosidase
MVSLDGLAGVALRWYDSALDLRIAVDDAGVALLSVVAAEQGFQGAAPDVLEKAAPARAGVVGLPLIDVLVGGSGRRWAGQRYSESTIGNRMLYDGHDLSSDGLWEILRVSLREPTTQLSATVVYRRLVDVGVLNSSVTLRNDGDSPVAIEAVSSFLGSGIAGPGGSLDDAEILWADNDWQAEARWRSQPFREALPQLGDHAGQGRSRGRFALTSVGTWSSGAHLPMGAVVNRRTGYTTLWQLEHNGAWHWQVGEHIGTGPTTSYLALLGPTDIEHQCRTILAPGQSFDSVTVALALSRDGFDDAVGKLTRYRRAIRRQHDDGRHLPVIFNDYMNTLNADPTTERLIPLIRAASKAGAEIFCIDAGWYASPGEDWWDAVGEWRPSAARFPNGFSKVLDEIRADGMVPGIWIEPEVVGVRSPVAESLPDEAFFLRDGQRVVEQDRYQLDLRHPAAKAHLDDTIDFLVDDLGIGYVKMDYNINVAPGTDTGGTSAGAGMLAHNRAFLGWIDEVLDRHPDLTLESCASGGMRTDYATLSRFQLHSTSDQEDPVLYAPIAAAAATAVTPEQAGVWASAQPEMSDELISYTLCSPMLSRLHLSGHLDQMTSAQQELVAEAVGVYKAIRSDVADGLPFWPIGLPRWDDPWLACGLRTRDTTYVVVWRREESADVEIVLPIAPAGSDANPHLLYPSAGALVQWTAAKGELSVRLATAPSACLIAIDVPGGAAAGWPARSSR